jgi:hypothetical protein
VQFMMSHVNACILDALLISAVGVEFDELFLVCTSSMFVVNVGQQMYLKPLKMVLFAVRKRIL